VHAGGASYDRGHAAGATSCLGCSRWVYFCMILPDKPVPHCIVHAAGQQMITWPMHVHLRLSDWLAWAHCRVLSKQWSLTCSVAFTHLRQPQFKTSCTSVNAFDQLGKLHVSFHCHTSIVVISCTILCGKSRALQAARVARGKSC